VVEFAADIFPFGGQLAQDFDLFFLLLKPGKYGQIALQFFPLLLEMLRLLLVLPGLGGGKLDRDGGELGPFSF
jgi:hypothetical protein